MLDIMLGTEENKTYNSLHLKMQRPMEKTDAKWIIACF